MDLIESLLPFQLDLYIQSDSQDPDSGAIIKQWNYYKSLPCSAKGIISNSTSTRTNDRQTMDNRYKNEQMIQIRTIEKLPRRKYHATPLRRQDVRHQAPARHRREMQELGQVGPG